MNIAYKVQVFNDSPKYFPSAQQALEHALLRVYLPWDRKKEKHLELLETGKTRWFYNFVSVDVDAIEYAKAEF